MQDDKTQTTLPPCDFCKRPQLELGSLILVIEAPQTHTSLRKVGCYKYHKCTRPDCEVEIVRKNA
jgi:hypothetical protein